MNKMILAAVLILGFSFSAQAEFKLAVVDTQKAILDTKSGKKADEELKKEGEKRQKEIEKKQADLKKKEEDLDKKRSVLSEEAFGKKAQELQQDVMQLRQMAQKAQADLQKKENELLAPIADKMKRIIEKIAKDKGFSMVIQTNPVQKTVIYSAAEFDITADVVSAFDKEK